MGVHDLWSIVEPVRESVPLYSLSGKTLAVDLSLWVCEAQHVQAMMGRVTRPHLRNLFFRVSSLTLMGVKLIFVMEGEAPQLKAETMRIRTEKRFGRFPKATASKSMKSTSRGRFRAVLADCAEMLDYMGVPWVTAAGEAEAMCAFLDSQGLVDGCITNDGDAFLYGAQTVYRNFNMNSKDPQVDCYKTSRFQKELHLSRENLVGLAILLGCDYIPKGIPGVGKEQALKLLQTLKGKTLLQRFVQWKEENAGVCEDTVKKVLHCNICRHPGSVRAHERVGCVLCDSKQFCQPQDYDYQCPCDWHCFERTRQASSIEANIRKKTVASQQFPFTQIINEFLVSKDKIVPNFKRRQPNMPLIQKFALEKMEWPKHYTSEKVLVLMTYAELMNRKCGRKMLSQIKPLRIAKSRTRNAVACFEVIWSTPDHYVFAEDWPAENQLEVRSVEEETLVRAACPEVVEAYLREKALAEESKTKKKKPKSIQSKTTDGPPDISDLLVQMSLHSSSSETSQMKSLLPNISNKTKPELIVLDSPVNQNPLQKYKVGYYDPHDGRHSHMQSHGMPEPTASPSVLSVIEALHLSNIDWDSSSFTSSPPPPRAITYTTELKPSENAHSGVDENSRATKDTDSEDVEGLHYTELPLRERVLMGNASRTLNKLETQCDKIFKQSTASIEYISSSNCDALTSVRNSILPGEKLADNRKDFESLTGAVHCVTSKRGTEDYASIQHVVPAAQAQRKNAHKSDDPRNRPLKHKFVGNAISSSVRQARCFSEPCCNADRSVSQTTKKSVCMNVYSSSEDSDSESKQIEPQRRTKIKPMVKSSLILGQPPKPLAITTPSDILLGPKSQQQSDIICISPSTWSKYQEIPSESEDVFPQNPQSPIIVLDSDDSVICNDSPLPLAERLRLKLLK